ncbi:MAG: DUF533 domain-containing protein [Dongiaceae bacterium]
MDDLERRPAMIDPKALLDQFLGSQSPGGQSLGGQSLGGQSLGGAGEKLGQLGEAARQKLDQAGGLGSFGAGAAAGGLLGLLLGSKKVRKMAGGAVGYGGAAALGALALRAYQSWQQGSAGGGATPAAADDAGFLPPPPPAASALPFELALVIGMIGAAKADGHIDAGEQQRIFAEVERRALDPAAKAMVFDALAKPVDLSQVTGAVRTPEQAGQLYLACRMVIDPDEPAERAYVEALAYRLNLPRELAQRLEAEVAALPAPARG